MNFWNGAFSRPKIAKHRDFEHDTFSEHEMANGATYTIDSYPVWVDRSPIDGGLQTPPRRSHFVDFVLHTGDKYEYLVETESDLSEPNQKRVLSTIDAYAHNPVRGGRDWLDYVYINEEDSTRAYDSDFVQHPRVLDRLKAGDRPKNPNAPAEKDQLEDILND